MGKLSEGFKQAELDHKLAKRWPEERTDIKLAYLNGAAIAFQMMREGATLGDLQEELHAMHLECIEEAKSQGRY